MIEAQAFLDAALEREIGFFTGVPCSFLTPLMNAVISDPRARYVGATSEGEAQAIAAGAWLAGQNAAVMCQNSGLGNAVNPVTSLNAPFRIPALMVVTWRGAPGLGDEPQHEAMGQITGDLLALIGVPAEPFPSDPEAIAPALDSAVKTMADGSPHALILAKGSVAKSPLTERPRPARPPMRPVGAFTGTPPPSRIEVLAALREALPGAGLIATTGYTGRELYMLEDADRHLYVVGSMGGASAIGLGAALNTDREIVVLDGDGAALMKLGNLATIGAEAPANLTHIVLDNGKHLSTGGQATVSPGVDFAAIAAACGYAQAARADTLPDALARLYEMCAQPGPRFLHLKVGRSDIADLPRPTIAPADVARRFRDWLNG